MACCRRAPLVCTAPPRRRRVAAAVEARRGQWLGRPRRRGIRVSDGIGVMVVEQESVVRRGPLADLATDPGIRVVGCAGTAEEG